MTLHEIHIGGNLFHATDNPEQHQHMLDMLKQNGQAVDQEEAT